MTEFNPNEIIKDHDSRDDYQDPPVYPFKTTNLTLHEGVFSTRYTAEGKYQLATVEYCSESGYVFQDHDSRLHFDNLQDALTYLFAIYGI